LLHLVQRGQTWGQHAQASGAQYLARDDAPVIIPMRDEYRIDDLGTTAELWDRE